MRRSRAAGSGRRPPEALEAGRHVFLRSPDPSDVTALAALAHASRRLHRPWVYPPTTAPAVRRWMGATGPTRHRLLVCRRADGTIAGVVNVSEIVRAALQSAYLGYYAFRPHAARGYMTEGLALVLRYAFRRLGLHRLEANIQPANLAARRLVRRLGFRKEGFSPRFLKIGGRWRDHERWAIVRETWPPRGVRRRGRRASRPGRPPLPRKA